MKLVYIFSSFAAKGGTERIFCDKMNWLAEVAGYEIVFVTYEQGNHPFAYPLSKKIRYVDLNTRFFTTGTMPLLKRIRFKFTMPRLFKHRLRQLLDEIQPNLVISTTNSLFLFREILSMPYRHVVESHVYYGRLLQYIFTHIPWLDRKISQHLLKMLKRCEKVVVLTHKDAACWKGYDNIEVIHNVVTNYPEKITDVADRPKRIIAVGRLHEQKGFDLLIQSWQLIAARHPDWQLVVYGHGGDLQKLQQQLEKAGLTSSMTFAGTTDNIYKEYQNSAFYVMSSRYEGWGLVLVEAMSCGLPCVSFDCPYGPSDIIRDGEDGFLVENGNIQQLAEKMELLINNKELRERLGVRARLNAARFTSDNIMPQWTKLFETIVQNDNH
ncbi:glycosyltransferase family 4 protein [Prevotella sp. P5-50]|uniref:glycosyltransferase family 4 protein n=1 Tax=Prevotella sp. P5-50 TaxID=2024217 RepID=UPI001303C35B|nr:glycosyltransferase family 4 protein [Prevotella sp. P5-50]